MNRDSFVFYRSFYEAIHRINDKELKADIFEAICELALNNSEIPIENGVGLAIISLIKPQLVANNKRYENSKKGGAPKGNQNAKKQPKNNKKQPNVNVNENDNVNVNVLNNNNFINGDLRLKEKVEEWIEYKKEKREPYKPMGLKSLLTQIENNCRKYGTSNVIDIITESMACNYKGILFDKLVSRKVEKDPYEGVPRL